MRGIDVRLERGASGILILRYVLRAEMLHVRVPSLEPPARADGLWKHTCFEAFISPGIAGGSYYELNFSPSRQWAIYRFEAYREGMSPADVTSPPELVPRRFDDRLELDATFGLADLGGLREARTLKLAVSTVVEDDSGNLSYWALKHAPGTTERSAMTERLARESPGGRESPAGKPDFHHPDGFVLELPP